MNNNIQPPVLGIIGVGQLTQFMVRGLRHGGWEGEIVLSPRNAQAAAALARTCQCKVAMSNQAAAKRAEIVMLAVRPPQVKEALASIRLRPEQTLLSVAAGLPIAQLQSQLAAGQRVVRALPVSSAEFGASPTMMYPADAAVETLFQHTGQSIVLTRESDFEIGTPIGCAYTWFLDLYGTLAESCERAGMGAQQARSLVYGMAEGAARVASHAADRSARAIAAEIAREGSFTLLGLTHLREKGGLSAWEYACELLTKRLRK
jgi:pyrroline-5-carboxylate reductase